MQAIDTALQTLFTADSTLMALVRGVYNTATPFDAEGGITVAYPALFFQQVSGADEYTLGGRVCTVYRYQIRVVDTGLDRTAMNAALERVDVLMMDATIVTGQTLYCRREGELPYTAEMDGGVIYQQVGATYRIEVHG